MRESDDGTAARRIDGAEEGGRCVRRSPKSPGLCRPLERKLEQVDKEAVERTADRLYSELRLRIDSQAEDLVENRPVNRSPGRVPVLSIALVAPR